MFNTFAYQHLSEKPNHVSFVKFTVVLSLESEVLTSLLYQI